MLSLIIDYQKRNKVNAGISKQINKEREIKNNFLQPKKLLTP